MSAAYPTPEEVAAMLALYYGTCACKRGHLCPGGHCPRWQPCGATTWEELRALYSAQKSP